MRKSWNKAEDPKYSCIYETWGRQCESLKLVHIDYISEDEFSMINAKNPREILSKYIESYGKKVANSSFRMQSDNYPRHTTKATGEVIAKKVKRTGMNKTITRFLPS